MGYFKYCPGCLSALLGGKPRAHQEDIWRYLDIGARRDPGDVSGVEGVARPY